MSKERYILAKQKWAEKQVALGVRPRSEPVEGRLPPGQRLTEGFPVLDLGIQPDIPLTEWTLRLDGLVANPTTFTWDTFGALPQVSDVSDFHCVTTWSKFDNTWQGVLFRTIYDLARVRPGAKHAMIHAYDGYYTNVPLSWLLDSDVLFALDHDGQPLSEEHGGPLRLVVPKLYAWKSAKWAGGIEFLCEDRRGYWEARGYHNRGEPFAEERYSYQETAAASEERRDR